MGRKINRFGGFMQKQINLEQARDSGLAIVLILLLIGYFKQDFVFIGWSIVILIVDMAVPQVFRPFAKVWLGISTILGTIMSKVVLFVVFFAILTPIGMIRGLFGADPMLNKQWRKGNASVFRVRNHRYRPEEIERPY